LQESTVLAVGRRKTASAVIRLTPGTGNIVVNGKPLEKYFGHAAIVREIRRPLAASGVEGKFDISCNAKGGGYTGQSGAITLGISRALAKYDETLRPVLKKEGLLTRDPRMVERKKYGMVKARKRYQFSKR